MDSFIAHSEIKEIYPHMIGDRFVICIRTSSYGTWYTEKNMGTSSSGVHGEFIKR